VRDFPPFPRRCTERACQSRSRIVSCGASLARAPELYRNRTKACSRPPCAVERLGVARSAFISSRSKQVIPGSTILLKGMRRIWWQPLQVFVTVLSDEPGQCMNCPESLIAGTGAAAARRFQMCQE
jgi:hypothetical protein